MYLDKKPKPQFYIGDSVIVPYKSGLATAIIKRRGRFYHENEGYLYTTEIGYNGEIPAFSERQLIEAGNQPEYTFITHSELVGAYEV